MTVHDDDITNEQYVMMMMMMIMMIVSPFGRLGISVRGPLRGVLSGVWTSSQGCGISKHTIVLHDDADDDKPVWPV
jgi:hypothetical protein